MRASPTGRLQATAFAGMFLYGIAAALLGAILPLLSLRLEIGLGRVGTLFLVLNASMLASSFALGSLQDRFGMKPPLVAGALVVGAALLVVAGAGRYSQLLLAVALLGVGGTALNGASNALAADLFEEPGREERPRSTVWACSSASALSSSRFLIGLLLRAVGLAGILVGEARPCVFSSRWRTPLPAYPPPKQAGGPVARGGRPVRPGAARAAGSGCSSVLPVRHRVHSRGLHVHVPDERSRDGRERRVLLPGGLLGGAHAHPRLAGARALVAHGGRLVLASAGVSAVVAALLVTASGPRLAVAMVISLGATLAGIFPAVLGVAGSRFPAHSGTVFGILFTMALSGGMTLPWVTGQAAAAWGLRPALGLVVLQLLAVLGLQVIVTAGRGRPATASSR